MLDHRPAVRRLHGFDQPQTLPRVAAEAGYKTALVGKYLNRYGKARPDLRPAGLERLARAARALAYRFFGFTINDNGVLTPTGPRTRPTC